MRVKTNTTERSMKNIFSAITELAEKSLNRKKNVTEEETLTPEQKKKAEELQRLKDQLGSVKREITTINAQFNDASEPECIAYYAYLLKATEAKYDYLLRLARESAATADTPCEEIS
jgi:hypothetical protein